VYREIVRISLLYQIETRTGMLQGNR
jgi:hypothetical protein